MLVLLIGRICESRVEMSSGGMIFVPNVMEIGTGVQAVLKFYHNKAMLVLPIGGTCEVPVSC